MGSQKAVRELPTDNLMSESIGQQVQITNTLIRIDIGDVRYS